MSDPDAADECGQTNARKGETMRTARRSRPAAPTRVAPAHLILLAMLISAVAIFASGCSSEPENCRFDPSCGGGVGSFCDHHDDCETGFCCNDDGNCRGGICTYTCRDDLDCPGDMRCEHDTCFFACDSNLDCAEGMSCEHDNTVCEWD